MKKLILLIFCVHIMGISLGQKINSAPEEIIPLRFHHPEGLTFRRHLFNNLSYPLQAIDKSISGVLMAGIQLDADGSLRRVFCMNSLHESIDNHILDLLEASESFWIEAPNTIAQKPEFIIIPFVFICAEGFQYHIDRDNVRFHMLEEVGVVAKWASGFKYKATSTRNLRRNLSRATRNHAYQDMAMIIYQLLRREPFNGNYYTRLIELELLLGYEQSACQNLRFLQNNLIAQPSIKNIESLNCF